MSPFGRFVRRSSLPNILTTVRIVLIPVFLWLILTSGSWADGGSALTHRWWALVVFILLMFTDQMDGHLARKYSVITDFGKLADPIADKALMISAFVSLNILGELWWWVTAIIVVRELGITIWRLVLARQGNVVPASKGGKLKTVLQTLAVVLFILPFGGVMTWVAGIVMAIAVVQTVVTGVQYILDSRRAN
ncbi:CDP-diacylglycerol--glycerol-3-phosphate 3-phosphatidyltransferase [Corynebacterium falsenii]|nr:CDP-diacylglycerol--glycerol-3-phosphate 3-phosphatidyltransferase [Corynebacterium falsenii]MDC7103407.1 CDP-diacylglycerol--glycerol-3-phosphate 3-phosphatidyltransferase [Corynebacterium falsenii]UBI05755.1 CDP-diacylglycerol--glycerol-3-phosphate 3-phosphatidyltransferase [Corynebacterium falsenii]UBI07848.1 CDP-diacylglycerol--glycerol-3-phosphate 3-phosphatidyltransferase [Corynebacterium falsenii]